MGDKPAGFRLRMFVEMSEKLAARTGMTLGDAADTLQDIGMEMALNAQQQQQAADAAKEPALRQTKNGEL